jgi:hypothetical protein
MLQAENLTVIILTLNYWQVYQVKNKELIMADAREYYFNALQNKRLRDAQNPITDAAAAGWATGLAKGAKAQTDNEDLANKANLEIGLAKMKQKQEMASKIIETHNILVDGVQDNSPKTINMAMQMLTTGQDTTPDGQTVHFVPKKTERTFQTEGEKMKELIALGQDPATLARLKAEKDKPVKPSYPAEQTIKNPDGSTLTQKGTTVQQAIPAVPAVPKKRLFNIPIPFTGSAAVPASTADVFVPAGQEQAQAQPPIPAQSVQPQIDPQDMQAYQWAMSNPEDPRSQAILIKLKNKHSR